MMGGRKLHPLRLTRLCGCLSVCGCHRFLDAGKKLFLCSNSGFSYVDGGLRYLLGASTTTIPSADPPPLGGGCPS